MAKQVINNTDTTPDTLKGAMTKVNENFTDLYNMTNMFYGEMYAYENTTALVIGTANQYFAVANSGVITGELSGFTFNIGVTGAIASVADYSATVAGTSIITVTAGHNLTTGDHIIINNSTDYNGAYRITTVSPTTFYITKAYTQTRTGAYTRGARLVASAGSAGKYRLSMALTAVSASSGKTIKFEINQNALAVDKIVTSKSFSNTEYTPLASTGIITVTAGDHLYLSVRNETSATNVTIRHLNINLSKISA